MEAVQEPQACFPQAKLPTSQQGKKEASREEVTEEGVSLAEGAEVVAQEEEPGSCTPN